MRENFIKSSSPSFLSEIKYLLKDKYPSLRGMLMRKSEPPIVAHFCIRIYDELLLDFSPQGP